MFVTDVDMSVEKNKPTLPFNAVDMVTGTFHQNNDRYSHSSRGKQCVGNVLAMLIHKYTSNGVSSADIDKILDSGDELYRKIIASRSSACNNSPYLSFEEIPNVLWTHTGIYNIHKFPIVSGITVDTNDISDIQTLQSALQSALNVCPSLMITVGAICSGVFVENGIYTFF